ncbi:MAG: hypothetical protein KDA36_12940, partial [Planctomycetaceae bacterium]|nr:hypothetical protein [Planctomycetaceae bacterium]
MSSSPIAIVAGHCDITPEIPLPLFGDRHRQGLSRGVDSHLECNVVILVQGDLRVAILQLDTLFTSRQLQDALTSRMNVPCNLLVVASHTHFAPALVGDKPLLGGFSEAYFQFVVDRVSDLVNHLLSETPASARILSLKRDCAAGVCRRKRLFSVNKTPPYVGITTAFLPNLDEKIDQSLTTIGLFDSSGNLSAVIWNWACHPTVSPLADHVSSEYVGFVRDRVRNHYQRDIPVVFLPGAMGDIRPKIVTSKPSLL